MDMNQLILPTPYKGIISIVEAKEEETGISNESLLLQYHQHFGYISFAKIQLMAKVLYQKYKPNIGYPCALHVCIQKQLRNLGEANPQIDTNL